MNHQKKKTKVDQSADESVVDLVKRVCESIKGLPEETATEWSQLYARAMNADGYFICSALKDGCKDLKGWAEFAKDKKFAHSFITKFGEMVFASDGTGILGHRLWLGLLGGQIRGFHIFSDFSSQNNLQNAFKKYFCQACFFQ